MSDLKNKILKIIGLNDNSSDEEIVHSLEKIFSLNLLNLKNNENKIKKKDLTVKTLLLKYPQLLQIELIEQNTSLKDKMQKRLVHWYRNKSVPTFTDLKGDVIQYRSLSNKHLGDKIAKSWGLPLPKKYGTYKFKDIPWNNMPNKGNNIVIKHTSEHCMVPVKNNKIYKANNVIKWEEVNNLSLQKYMERLVKSDKFATKHKTNNKATFDYNTYGEWIIEEYLNDYDSRFFIPRDFKCLCISGKVWYIVVIDRNTVNNNTKYYTRDFIPLRSYYENKNRHEPLAIKKPERFAELIKYAEIASANCKNLMRFDFYITKMGVKFGEFTTWPKGGNQQHEAKNFYNQLMELYE